MIIAYHAIFTTYGTWLPNDPRGSYSAEVYNRKLRDLGGIQYGRQDPQPPRSLLDVFWDVARPKLARNPYFINDQTRPLVAKGLGEGVRRIGAVVHACAVMNDHVHLVVARGRYKIEYIVNRLKGSATSKLGLRKTPWTRNAWKVYLNDENALHAAVAYVEANPRVAGMALQRWDFVTPLDA